MNYWLRRAELKEMAEEFMNTFRGMSFLSPQLALQYLDGIKGDIYARHPKIVGEISIRLQISESVPGRKYSVIAVSIKDTHDI